MSFCFGASAALDEVDAEASAGVAGSGFALAAGAGRLGGGCAHAGAWSNVAAPSHAMRSPRGTRRFDMEGSSCGVEPVLLDNAVEVDGRPSLRAIVARFGAIGRTEWFG
jgi:hypothetical protein